MNTLIKDIPDLISLGLTFPTVLLASTVLYVWLPSALQAVRSNYPTANDWFIIGVAVMFFGESIDHAYSLIPWSSAFMEKTRLCDFMDVTVLFNMAFRQGCCMIAAYCHLKAAELAKITKLKNLNKLLFVSNILGLVYIFSMMLVKMSQ